ncbi:MAG: aldehyde dehydrogenase family protein [Gammaproteobacteria bacterium]|nr:aldehyde dehydrogenase family protein [Gammaproteobacteria bacterium]
MSGKFGDRLMYIDGQFVPGSDGQWIDSVNPGTEEVHGRVPAGTAADVDRAVNAAEAAQPGWAAHSIWERRDVLRKLAAAMRARASEVLPLEAADTGNTIGSLGRDVEVAANYLDFFAGLGTEIKGDSVPASKDGTHFSIREPYGVVARIVPFNHPFLFSAAHLAAPLMAGNAVVLKTPETSPLSGTLMGEICHEVLPPGLVNIVHGAGLPTGDALVRHPKIWRIGFTGSVPTGLAIQRSAAEVAVKHVSLELGGKNAMIACADADPATIATEAVRGMNFAWAGQSCGSNSRLLLHESLYEDVVARIVAQVRTIRVGDALDPASQMGPVNSAGHYRRVLSFVESARQDGAKLLTGGERPPGADFRRGYWIQPTVYGDVTMNMRVAREEVFGPILSILKWRTQEEAIAMANATEYGLTAGVWTHDLKVAMRFVRALQSGFVYVNNTARHFVGTPFGGWKNSGLGNEECLGELLSYTRNKAVHIFV